MVTVRALFVVVALSALAGRAGAEGKMKLSSTAFADHGAIPSAHTCEGADRSPPLAWSGAPAGTKSFALVVDDPDAPDPRAPKMTWVHWVAFDIPPTVTSIAEAAPSSGRDGVNDFQKGGWGGPCPPVGRHRYFFKLYALDTLLPSLNRPTKAALEKAMKGHVLATAELVGTYQKGHVTGASTTTE